MEARFFSDTELENFKDEAELVGFEVLHTEEHTRDVTISTNHDGDDETLRALVYLNGGDVLQEKPPEKEVEKCSKCGRPREK